MPAHRLAGRTRAASLLLALALVATSCSSDEGGDETSAVRATLGPVPVESGQPAEGKPTRGGQLVYGLEAESEGYCLPESQLAISGLQVARTIYDPLTVPDAKGGYAPYLAKSIHHSDDHKIWTINLRPGITFHDGSKLDSTVLKNNLDAYRGQYPARSALLFAFVFNNIDTIDVVNPLSVRIRMKNPWVAFPATLYSSGRILIVGQSQLDASTEDCDTRPIGTGPFSFVSWTKGVSLKVKRNPNYWQKAPDGKPYPYLNAIEYRPMPNSDARLAALEQGDLNMLHSSTTSDMAENLGRLRDDGGINLLVSEERTEINYLMINSSEEPLKSRATRVAIAQALDRDRLNEQGNKGFATIADGPFAPDVLGYLEDPGFPKYDLDAARKAVAKMKATGQRTTVRLLSSTAPASVRQSAITKDMLEKAGFTVTLEVEAEADLIGRAIAGDFELLTFRNQPGDDPDSNRVWWFGEGNPVNFGRFDDPVISRLLDEGRSTPDQAKRKKIYEDINRQFAKNVWNVWFWFAPWAIAEAPNVHGILGPDLPADGGPPSGRLATGHSVLGIWIDQNATAN